jgi:hypothetical protein
MIVSEISKDRKTGCRETIPITSKVSRNNDFFSAASAGVFGMRIMTIVTRTAM